MGDVKKKTTKKTTKTSSVKKNINKEVVLSNDELLEQILNKKKTKSTKKTTTKSSTTKKTEQKKVVSKKTKQFNTLENDFIYDQIKSGKTKKKTTTTTKKKVDTSKKEESKRIDSFKEIDKEKTIEEIEKELGIEEEIVKEEKIKEKKYDTYNSLEEKVKARKENKQDEFEEFITEIENAKLLADIRKALEDDRVEYVKPEYEVSNKKAIEKIDSEINERLKKDIKVHVEKKLNVKFIILAVIAVLIILLGVISALNHEEYSKFVDTIKEENKAEKERLEKEKKQKEEYESCLIRPLDENDNGDEINKFITEFNTYLNDKYRASVMYEDLTYGFTFAHEYEEHYYAASTIKSLAAMYIYEKAYAGEINLDDTMTYSSKYRRGTSLEMKNHKYGEKISLRDLVKYSITVSDNTAHYMLFNYIGVNKLKEYGNIMGANLTHLNGDLFGYIDLDDAISYMKHLNYLINNTGDYGVELESYFLTADQNYLELPDYDIKAAHKYGEYEYYYHDLGIVYDKNPYVIAILTHEGRKDFSVVIKDINLKVYELHNLYYKNRETYCKTSVYGQ